MILDWIRRPARQRQPITLPTLSDYPPIFVRGVSRSGGTLVVTILDSHPEIGMSYELDPSLLSFGDPTARSAEYFGAEERSSKLDIASIEKLLRSRKTKKDALRLLASKQLNGLKVFIARAARSGLDHLAIADLLQFHREKGGDFTSTEGRLKFIELVSLCKMHQQNKKRWGLKCSSQFSDYLQIWPDAYFINILRDGRDVLASQLNTGNFNASPTETGKGWATTHLNFRELVTDSGVNAHELYYEKLARDPAVELEKLCKFLQVPYSESLLNFHNKDLSIYKNPAAHLSLDRISTPIDTSKIGRWKSELSSQQLDEFYSSAGEAMKLFGYLE